MRASNHGSAVRTAESTPDWSQILADAVTRPGVISAAYSAFWNYSVGNQLLAWFQCLQRGIELGPIHTFAGWLKLDRSVRKGERGITLCMPVTWTDSAKGPPPRDDPVDPEPAVVHRLFIYRPHWFVLSQTDGAAYQPLAIPQWDERLALHTLLIDRVPFQSTNGNCQGYATGRTFAVSPLAFLAHRTCLHEIAHVVLGHTQELQACTDREERTPRDLREVEAEAVALICCQSLGLPGEEFSRGYLQHWLGRQAIEERSVQKILRPPAPSSLPVGPVPRESDQTFPPKSSVF